jgi:hypothetical protein
MRQIEIAQSYVGQFEISGNQGFKSPEFEKKMHAVGWDKGEAWCILFAELVYKEAYPELYPELEKLFSDSVVETHRLITKAGYEPSSIPVLGSLMIMQHYTNNKPDWTGHAGVVTQVHSHSTWVCVEGNTNSKGSREGDSVQYKTRSLMYYETGLRVKGFFPIPLVK